MRLLSAVMGRRAYPRKRERESEKRLRGEWNGSRSCECAGEAGEEEVGVKRDLLKPANPDRAESPLVLQAPELPLHGGAATVETDESKIESSLSDGFCTGYPRWSLCSWGARLSA